MPKVIEETRNIGKTAGYLMLAAEIIFYGLLEEKTGIKEWEKPKYIYDEYGERKFIPYSCGFLDGYSTKKIKREYPEIFAETMEILTEKYLVDPAAADFRTAAKEMAVGLLHSAAVKRKVRSGYGAGHML